MSALRASVIALVLTGAGLTVIACGAVWGGPWRIATGVVVAALIAGLLAATWAEDKQQKQQNEKETNHV